MRARRGIAIVMGAAAAAGMALGAGTAAAQPSEPPPADVPGCERGCEVVFNQQLPNDVVLQGLQTTDENGFTVGLLAYWIGDTVRDVTAPDGLPLQYLGGSSCGFDGDASRCAVLLTGGAHSSGAASVLLTGDRGIEITDTVVGSTPNTRLAELDDSPRADLVVEQSTYEPDYATGPRYWETYLEFDGQFVRTGCTEIGAGAPTEPVYGEHCQPF